MTDLADEYAKQVLGFFNSFERAFNATVFHGEQPWELAEFPGGECPGCHGRGSSHGPEQGFPCGWTCDTCGGSGKLGKVWLKRYLPYPDEHPNKGTEWERTGWKT